MAFRIRKSNYKNTRNLKVHISNCDYVNYYYKHKPYKLLIQVLECLFIKQGKKKKKGEKRNEQRTKDKEIPYLCLITLVMGKLHELFL